MVEKAKRDVVSEAELLKNIIQIMQLFFSKVGSHVLWFRNAVTFALKCKQTKKICLNEKYVSF